LGLLISKPRQKLLEHKLDVLHRNYDTKLGEIRHAAERLKEEQAATAQALEHNTQLTDTNKMLQEKLDFANESDRSLRRDIDALKQDISHADALREKLESEIADRDSQIAACRAECAQQEQQTKHVWGFWIVSS